VTRTCMKVDMVYKKGPLSVRSWSRLEKAARLVANIPNLFGDKDFKLTLRTTPTL
jgi:hypothetical protein